MFPTYKLRLGVLQIGSDLAVMLILDLDLLLRLLHLAYRCINLASAIMYSSPLCPKRTGIMLRLGSLELFVGAVEVRFCLCLALQSRRIGLDSLAFGLLCMRDLLDL